MTLARDLRPGDLLERGPGRFWTVRSNHVEARNLGGPVAVLSCLDEHGTIREFSLPDDQQVTATSPEVGHGLPAPSNGHRP